MISKEELLEYREKAEEYLFDRFEEKDFVFNYFGIKTSSKEEYQNMKKELTKDGKLYNEVFWSGKNKATIQNGDIIFELSEPNPEDNVKAINIDHISFVTDQFDKYDTLLKDEVIRRFDVGNTHGIKILANGIIIEIRNNDIVESVNDFSKKAM